MLGTNLIPLHWRPLADKEHDILKHEMRIRRGKKASPVLKILNWVSWWFLTASNFSPPSISVLFYFPEKLVNFFFLSHKSCVHIDMCSSCILLLCVLVCTSLTQFQQKDGSSYADFKSSKLCQVIMHMHLHSHFYRGQIRQNWTLHYFQAETGGYFLYLTNGMFPRCIS